MGVVGVFVGGGHIVMMLIRLEYVNFGVMMMLGCYLVIVGLGVGFMVVYLIFIVVEGVVGLGVVVSLVRWFGWDNLLF